MSGAPIIKYFKQIKNTMLKRINLKENDDFYKNVTIPEKSSTNLVLQSTFTRFFLKKRNNQNCLRSKP